MDLTFITGPLTQIGNTYFDQTQVARGKAHGAACPATPPPATNDNDLNSFILLNYYDLPLTMRIAYERSKDPIFLDYFRKAADAWWQHPTWIGEGSIRLWPDSAAPPPRHAGIGGLILRALDGRPEMWDWIVAYTQAHLDIWCKSRINNDQLWYGPREVAFSLQHAAWVAGTLPDSFPNAAQIRAQLIADLENLVVNYTGRLQYPDGSWRDTSEWLDNVMAVLTADAPAGTSQLKVIPLTFPLSAGQKVGFWNGGLTKTTKAQSAGSTVIDVEPLPVSRVKNDYLSVDDGTMVGSMQPFIVGLLADALVDVHQVVVSDVAKESAKNQILKACRHLYSDGPYAKDLVEQRSGKRVRGFHYFFHGGTTLNPTKYEHGDMVAPWTDLEGWWLASTRQAISTILPAFAYAFKLTGNTYFRDAYNEMYDSAYSGADGFRAMLDDTPKNYNQHCRRVPASLGWIGGVVAPPVPLPTPSPAPPPDPVPVPQPDSGAPVVVITSPVDGATISGLVSVAATATDPAGIDVAYLILDGATVSASGTAPYSVQLDSRTLSDGPHSIYVRAWNTVGKAGDSQKINVIVANAAPVPTEPPAPTPTPIPPTPTPQPVPCSISAPASITVPRNSSGDIEIRLNNLTQPTPVSVSSGSDGQVTVTPLSQVASSTKPTLIFKVRTKNKKQSRAIAFTSSCGVVSVRVNVV